ncbi:hypothetical protein [Marinomonas algicola]|jgi:type II secretory pathway component PulF|uniref:hypothetical protein n=1 Tax=Marinomonas algicola TaxID=2773454 RepID=UPI00174AE535|nr:hypothetical protein [Marinomonas algicola]
MMKQQNNAFFYYISDQRNDSVVKMYNAQYIVQFKHKNWEHRLVKKRVHKINSVSLMSLLKELNSSMELGMTLNETILGMSTTRGKSTSLNCLYISQQINLGVPVHQAISEICDNATQFLCEFLPKNTTQEGFTKSLTIMLEYLRSRKEAADKLLKSLYYPFFITQVSIIVMIVNSVMQSSFQLSLLMLYAIISLAQCAIVYYVISGKMIFFLERFFSSLRLYNFFELLLASMNSGDSLQDSIKKIALSSSHHLNKKQLYILYYKIRLGFEYSDSFPKNWFLQESQLALVNSNKNGSIERALSMASECQKQRWSRTLNTLNNVLPILSLLIAGFFVARLLINIYSPLMEPF